MPMFVLYIYILHDIHGWFLDPRTHTRTRPKCTVPMRDDWCYHNILHILLLCGHWVYWGLEVLWWYLVLLYTTEAKVNPHRFPRVGIFGWWQYMSLCASYGVISSCTSTGRWLKLIDFRNAIFIWILNSATGGVAVGDMCWPDVFRLRIVMHAKRCTYTLFSFVFIFSFDMKVTKNHCMTLTAVHRIQFNKGHLHRDIDATVRRSRVHVYHAECTTKYACVSVCLHVTRFRQHRIHKKCPRF